MDQAHLVIVAIFDSVRRVQSDPLGLCAVVSRSVHVRRDAVAQGLAHPAAALLLALVPVARVVGQVASAGSQNLGEESDEDHAYGGHAGADDADVDLDGGPLGYLEVLPGRVLRVMTKLDE